MIEKLKNILDNGRPKRIFVNQATLNNYSDEAQSICGCSRMIDTFEGIKLEIDNSLKNGEIKIEN